MFRRGRIIHDSTFMLRDLSTCEGRRSEINENTKTEPDGERINERAMVEMKANDGKNNSGVMKLKCFKCQNYELD